MERYKFFAVVLPLTRLATAPTTRTSFPQNFRDRKSTRLNSSHLGISYAVFCLKKKTDSHAARLHGTAQRLHVHLTATVAKPRYRLAPLTTRPSRRPSSPSRRSRLRFDTANRTS